MIREDALWNRPVFKAPPLNIKPQIYDATIFEHDLRRVSVTQR